jgi:hypothetical protein
VRRRPFALPYEDQVPALAALLDMEGSAVAAPADLSRFLAAADHHNVLGFVMAATHDGRLPLSEAARRRVSVRAGKRALHGRVLRRALPEVVDALERGCGVAPVLVKGAALADRYYPMPSLRPSVDLDLVMPREALLMAAGALRERGFEEMVEFRRGYAERHGHDIHVFRRDGGVRLDVELHWRVGDDPVGVALDHAFLAEGADRVVIEGAQVSTPSPPRHLLALSVHLLSDREKRLCWVHDIALVAGDASAQQWEETFAQADRVGLSWVLHRALDYSRRHLGFERSRPRPAGDPPPFGPLRAVEELDARAAPHLGRLVSTPWREKPGYLAAVIFPTRAGLEGTVGGDGASTWRLAKRHGRRVVRGLTRRG